MGSYCCEFTPNYTNSYTKGFSKTIPNVTVFHKLSYIYFVLRFAQQEGLSACKNGAMSHYRNFFYWVDINLSIVLVEY